MSTLSVALYTFSFAKVFSISFLKDKSRNYKSTILSAQNDIQEASLSGSKHDPASTKKTLKSLSKASVKLASLNDSKLNSVIDALNTVCKAVEKKKYTFDISKLFADVPMDKSLEKVCSCRKRKAVEIDSSSEDDSESSSEDDSDSSSSDSSDSSDSDSSSSDSSSSDSSSSDSSSSDSSDSDSYDSESSSDYSSSDDYSSDLSDSSSEEEQPKKRAKKEVHNKSRGTEKSKKEMQVLFEEELREGDFEAFKAQQEAVMNEGKGKKESKKSKKD